MAARGITLRLLPRPEHGLSLRWRNQDPGICIYSLGRTSSHTSKETLGGIDCGACHGSP